MYRENSVFRYEYIDTSWNTLELVESSTQLKLNSFIRSKKKTPQEHFMKF